MSMLRRNAYVAGEWAVQILVDGRWVTTDRRFSKRDRARACQSAEQAFWNAPKSRVVFVRSRNQPSGFVRIAKQEVPQWALNLLETGHRAKRAVDLARTREVGVVDRAAD